MFDAVAVGGKAAAAVESIDGAVEGLMCFAEIGGHEDGIVEVGQRFVGMVDAGGENGVGVEREALEAFWGDEEVEGRCYKYEADGVAVSGSPAARRCSA